jgi:pyruvate ferredoxin oxidoreductase beta subunit
VPGWKIEPNSSVKIGRLAAQTGLYPLLEYENKKLTGKMELGEKKIKVEEYLKLQGRFKHLFKDKRGKEQIKKIQQIADANIEKYDL